MIDDCCRQIVIAGLARSARPLAVAEKRRFAEESLWADVIFTSTSTFYDLTHLYKLEAKQHPHEVLD